MSNPFSTGVGCILSADIAVPQYDRVLRFYSQVLSTGAQPLWREDLMNNLGMPVIGLGEHSAEYAGLPLQWMPHMQVADVALSVERALNIGGSEVLHAQDDDGKSQWAVLLDPNGAAFGVIPVVAENEHMLPKDVTPSDSISGVGCISSLDLTVTQATVSSNFYQQVIGWSVQETQEHDSAEQYTDYTMYSDVKSPAARIQHARGVNRDLPAVWLLQLPVGDLVESLRRVHAEGGKVIMKKTDTGGVCRYALVQDPVGVYLALVSG